jgi:SAM-dependent methyltransferase
MGRNTQEYWERLSIQERRAGSVYASDLDWAPLKFANMLGRVAAGKRVLDCGSGKGVYTKFLYDAGASVTGLDFTAPLVLAANQTFPMIRFHQANILTLDLNQQFDIITGIAFLHEIDHEDTPQLLRVLERHLAPGGFCWFFENSFFNPVARFIRKRLIGKHGIPKYGSEEETPFDPERWKMYQDSFRFCTRSTENFVTFSRIWMYFVRKGPETPWLWADQLISAAPIEPLRKNWSYIQNIYFSRDLPKKEALKLS